MKKTVLLAGLTLVLLSCNAPKDENKEEVKEVTEAPKAAVELPFKASYSTSWNSDVSDEDLKMVLTTYKDWADGNMAGLQNAFADTIDFDQWDGQHMRISKGDLIKMWTPFRDSLSAIEINMQSWDKMYSTDKKEGYIVAWYDETDTYKDGKKQSATWHDINQVKDGKIVWYSQYRRTKK